MGVYNPKARFPRNCQECHYYNGLFCPYLDKLEYFNAETVNIETRHPDCPLVELQPHGDLIDRDTLLSNWHHIKYVRSAIVNAPIVLGAEVEPDRVIKG